MAAFRGEQMRIDAAKKRKVKKTGAVPNTARGVEITSTDFRAQLKRSDDAREKEAADKLEKSTQRKASILLNKEKKEQKKAAGEEKAKSAADAAALGVPVVAEKKKRASKKRTAIAMLDAIAQPFAIPPAPGLAEVAEEMQEAYI